MLVITTDTDMAIELARACGQQNDFHHCDDPEPTTDAVVRILETHDVDAVVIGSELQKDLVHQLIADISEQFPFVGIVLFTKNRASDIRAAFRSGATDVVTNTMKTDEVAAVIQDARQRMARRLIAAPSGPQVPDQKARIITALSPRGGVGRTLIATGLAVTLERRFPGEVVLVDLDLQCGDVAPLLGLTPALSVASVSGRSADLDSADVKAILSQDAEGLHVLAAPNTLGTAVEVTPELVTALLQVLSVSFQYVVIDTGPYMAETTLSALDLTTDIMLLCAPDVPSVRALGRATDALDELRIVAPRRHLVINKATDRYGMPLRDIEAVSGMSLTGQLPAAKEIAMSLNRGTPFHEAIHPRSIVAKALASIVDELAPGSGQERRSLLRRLR